MPVIIRERCHEIFGCCEDIGKATHINAVGGIIRAKILNGHGPFNSVDRKDIIARATRQRVITCTAIKGVVTSAAIQPVVPVIAKQRIVTIASIDQIVAIAAFCIEGRPRACAVNEVIAVIHLDAVGILGHTDEGQIIACAAMDFVVALTACQNVVAVATVNRVGPDATDKRITALAAINQVWTCRALVPPQVLV